MKILTKKCLGCGKTIIKPYTESLKDWTNRHKFCSRICSNVYWKGKHKNPSGEFGNRQYTPWLKGTKGIAKPNSGSFKKDSVPWHKGRKGVMPTPWNKGKRFEAVTGPKHHNWKGGITEFNVKIRGLPEMTKWRMDVFKRDQFTCQECGIDKVYVEAHHLKKFSLILKENSIASLESALACSELWDINNGQTLCRKCHDKTK